MMILPRSGAEDVTALRDLSCATTPPFQDLCI